MKYKSKRWEIINKIRMTVFGLLVIVILLTSACSRAPIADSQVGRITEARKYVRAMDLKALVDDLADENSSTRPAMDKGSFRAFVRSEARWSDLEQTISGALVKNFTASEIRTLAEFQNSPAGRSFIDKLPAFQAEVGPPLQAEIQRVLAAGEFTRTRVHWDSPIQELGISPAGEPLTTEFAFRNEGSQPIRFLSIATSCGCTTAKSEKAVYLPGEKGTIRVMLTQRILAGLQEERVFVTTDEPENPSITLQLKVMISAPLKITPRLLVWGAGEKSAVKTVTIEIPPGQAMEIIGIGSVPAAFSTRTILDKASQIFLVHVTPRATDRPMAGKFVILAADGAGKALRIPVYLRVLPPRAPAKSDGSLPWGDVLWIDARSAADYGRSHISGALPLTEEAWDAQFESILARWTPGIHIVVYSQPPGRDLQVIERLKACGLEDLYIIAPGD